MSGTATERLRAYLAELPPRAQSLLLREFEREAGGGDNAAVARFVLSELRQLTRRADGELLARGDEAVRLVFRPLEPFLIDSNTPQSGAIRRNLLLQVWQWLKRDVVAEPLQKLHTALEATTSPARAADRAVAISDFQRVVAIALSDALNSGPADLKRIVGRIGPNITAEDVASMAALLRARDLLESLERQLPRSIENLVDTQLTAVQSALTPLQNAVLLPFALMLTMKRLREPWQIIRLATRSEGSDLEPRLMQSPYAIAIPIVIEQLAVVSATLREEMRRGQTDTLAVHLGALYHGVRGLCAEIDLRPDGIWGRQIAAIRAEISKTLRAEFDTIPSRVRRLLRQRVGADITPATTIDIADVQFTVRLIVFLSAGRNFAGELAVNEITMRVWSELTQYVGATGDLLIAALRGCPPAALNFRRQQADAAIAFSAVLFGADHAARMRRSADMAESEPPAVAKTA